MPYTINLSNSINKGAIKNIGNNYVKNIVTVSPEILSLYFTRMICISWR
jgi:hypothetical protein